MSVGVRSSSVLLIALVLAGAGCSQGGEGDRRTDAGGDDAAPSESGAVVAVVDGVPITAARVARLAAETGEAPRDVVQRLIELELLAAEARRRGLRGGGDLRETTRKAMVQRYLELEFEGPRTAAAIPDEWLRDAYERNKGRFVHPRFFNVDHILVRKGKGQTPAERAVERALAEKIRREALKTTSPEDFMALAKRFDGVDGQKVVAEKITNPVFERANLAKEFIRGAMALERVGDISPPVTTRFGTHVIYLVKINDALDRSFEDVREEVRAKEHPYWLQAEFAAMIERLRQETQVEGYEGDLRRGDEVR